MAPKLRITQVKSIVGRPRSLRLTIRALGLKRIGQSVEHEDRPEIRGMARKVSYLVRVEEIE